MRRISPAAFTLVAPAMSLSLAACGSDGAAELVPPATTTQTSFSPSSAPPESAESSPESPAAAEAFTTYAEGGRPAVPWAGTVIYRISGDQVARFDSAFADRRETWNGCPSQTVTYEGRDCPVSPLRTIARFGRDGGEVVYETETPSTVGCNPYQAAGAEATTTIWIRPQEQHRDCFTDFAVAVTLDGLGRVVAVDFMLSGP